MNYFENTLSNLIALEEKLDSDTVDVKTGDQDCNTVLDNHLLDLRDIIDELRKHHESLTELSDLITNLKRVQL